MNLLVKDERRLQLLESRLGNTPLASNVRSGTPDEENNTKSISTFPQTDDNARLTSQSLRENKNAAPSNTASKREESEVSTEKDHSNEVIVINDSNNSQGNQPKTKKQKAEFDHNSPNQQNGTSLFDLDDG